MGGNQSCCSNASEIKSSCCRFRSDVVADGSTRPGSDAQSLVVGFAVSEDFPLQGKDCSSAPPKATQIEKEAEKAPVPQSTLNHLDGDSQNTKKLEAVAQKPQKKTSVRRATNSEPPDPAKLLLEFRAYPEANCETNRNAFVRAVSQGKREVVSCLLAGGDTKEYLSMKFEKEMSPIELLHDQMSPLMVGAGACRTDIVREMLTLRAELEVKDKNHWTALMHAAHAGSSDIVSSLLEQKAKVTTHSTTGLKPLMQAASQGHDKVVALLLSNQAACDKLDFKGWTALSYASAAGAEGVIRVLLEASAKVDISSIKDLVKGEKGDKRYVQGSSQGPLYQAASNGQGTAALALLWQTGVTKEMKQQAVEEARKQGHTSTVRRMRDEMLHISTGGSTSSIGLGRQGSSLAGLASNSLGGGRSSSGSVGGSSPLSKKSGEGSRGGSPSGKGSRSAGGSPSR